MSYVLFFSKKNCLRLVYTFFFIDAGFFTYIIFTNVFITLLFSLFYFYPAVLGKVTSVISPEQLLVKPASELLVLLALYMSISYKTTDYRKLRKTIFSKT